jgi:hypothetical protein
VQSIPAPARLTPIGRRPRRAALIAALAAAVAIAAGTCVVLLAGSHAASPAKPRTALYRGLIQGVPLQSARCVQWNAATEAERGKVAAALSYSVGGATPYGNGTTLEKPQAFALFDRACSSPIAQHWLLYELYIRAAGFRSYVAPQT